MPNDYQKRARGVESESEGGNCDGFFADFSPVEDPSADGRRLLTVAGAFGFMELGMKKVHFNLPVRF